MTSHFIGRTVSPRRVWVSVCVCMYIGVREGMGSGCGGGGVLNASPELFWVSSFVMTSSRASGVRRWVGLVVKDKKHGRPAQHVRRRIWNWKAFVTARGHQVNEWKYIKKISCACFAGWVETSVQVSSCYYLSITPVPTSVTPSALCDPYHRDWMSRYKKGTWLPTAERLPQQNWATSESARNRCGSKNWLFGQSRYAVLQRRNKPNSAEYDTRLARYGRQCSFWENDTNIYHIDSHCRRLN